MDDRDQNRCTKDDLGLCGLHEYLEEDRKEHRANVCTKIKNVQYEVEKMKSQYVNWKMFALCVVLVTGMISWVYVDHFALSNKVSYNTALIYTKKDSVRAIDGKIDKLIHIIEKK